MPIDLTMPALSPTMTEGTLARWLKNENDSVQSGDILAEIETDKATMEVEAIDDGILAKIFIPAGTENVAVNTVIGLLLEEGEDPAILEGYSVPTSTPSANSITKPEPKLDPEPTPPPAAIPEQPKASPSASVPLPDTKRVFASPLARRIASQKGIDLHTISGSGPHGRIVQRDVENAEPRHEINAPDIPLSEPKTIEDLEAPATFTRKPLSTLRKVIAERLTEAKQTIPHFYLSADCRIDSLVALRTDMNDGVEKHEKISVNDLIIKACALALMRQPQANACFDGDAIKYFDHADIAVAVSIPDGLVTPVVRRADQHSLSQISRTVKGLADRARKGKLAPSEYQGGSFTISNLGMFGVDQFQAVINPPHACILAVGRGRKTPIVDDDGNVQVAKMMNITLSVDHRAVDGATAALLLEEIKRLIEQPVKMLI